MEELDIANGNNIRESQIRLNDKCQEQPPKTVQPNDTYGGTTYIGHMFRIRDEKTKEEIGFIDVEPSSAKVDILKKGIK